MNLIALAIFTLAAGYLTMAATSAYDVQSVLLALCMTTGSSAAIIFFAIFVKKDLTTWVAFGAYFFCYVYTKRHKEKRERVNKITFIMGEVVKRQVFSCTIQFFSLNIGFAHCM
ncbi:hypothetical protein ANCCAN_13948 [Ancylostoma caninum]|uniref:Uncharacterized protein n=1 Tax=Ancylostoma caninum TaxID=29170 RepID=A0A368G6Q5_ANCCA|nr:hypothetical protein ANCCAN_13948 [Ancylostoma caninum]